MKFEGSIESKEEETASSTGNKLSKLTKIHRLCNCYI